MRRPSMMLGYRNLPEKTTEAIDAHGWLHSGDVGKLDKEGYLRIIDWKKEMIINVAGHNMSPANVEARLSLWPTDRSDGLHRRTRPVQRGTAPSGSRCAGAFAVRHDISDASLNALCSDLRVLDEFATGVARADAQLSLPERMQRWALLDCQWLPGGEELTPTMKLQRQPIPVKYAADIEALYQGDASHDRDRG